MSMERVRKQLLHLMLWGLGLAAVLGAMAVLFGTGELLDEIAMTVFLVALAAGFLMVCARLMDRAAWRAAGFVGMVCVVVELVLLLALTWRPTPFFYDEFLMGSAGSLPPCAVGAVVCLGLAHRAGFRWGGWCGVVLAGSVFACWELASLFGQVDLHEIARKWGGTGGALAGYGLLAVFCIVAFDDWRPRPWRWGGVLATLIGLGTSLWGIWLEVESSETFLVAVSSVAVVAAHANLILLPPLPGRQRVLQSATVGAAIAAALLLDAATLRHDGIPAWTVLGRLAAAFTIFAAAGTLAVLVLARLSRPVDVEHTATEVEHLTLFCPLCQKKQTLPLGTTACGGCGARFELRVEAPQCAHCGYLLYGVSSHSCPECGADTGVPSGSVA